MSESRTSATSTQALRVGVLTSVATLVGATLGVAATLFVTQRNIDEASAAETRARRADAYGAYLSALDEYWRTAVSYAEAPEEHCASWVGPGWVGTAPMPGTDMSDSTCVALSQPPMELGLALEDARRMVLIYGSEEAADAVQRVEDEVLDGGGARLAGGINLTGEDQRAFWEAEWGTYTSLHDAFVDVMCEDLPAAEGACERLVGSSGLPDE